MIDDYIDFYNHRRIQKKLNWNSPVKYLEGAA
ncbi:MAG: IS3 family transposase [Treponema sp.]|nr:IS3 family transposase [Candidatus Treponema scatequi]MBQ0163384.1 IS3 family transposase [Candidatus Treponema scatequi]